MIEVTEKPIPIEQLIEEVQDNAYGAVVTFLGTVRDYSRGKKVLHMFYDAYKEMAEKKLREIAEEIGQKWGLKDATIVHRVGRLELGEVSLLIAVASPHRREAFEACQYAVNRIKQIVPIWKKEVWEDGEGWVESEWELGN